MNMVADCEYVTDTLYTPDAVCTANILFTAVLTPKPL